MADDLRLSDPSIQTLTSVPLNALVPVYDVNDHTDFPDGTQKNATVASLLAAVGASSAPSFSGVNQSGSTISAGQVVAVHSSGVGVVLAKATASGYPGIGLATGSVTAAAGGTYQTDGPLTLADWSGVLDTAATNLTPKGLYFLSTTDGKLSMAVPTTAGQLVQPIGYAVNASTLEIEIGQPMLL